VVPLFGWLASRVPRMRLITITTLFFASNLVLFYFALQAQMRIGVVFYIWIGIFNVFIVSQFWAFANDLYTEGQGRRLFPMIVVGMSLGAWVGASSVIPLIRRWQVPISTLMLVGAVVLIVALTITIFVNAREVRRSGHDAAKINEAPLDRVGAFTLIARDRYLTWIALLTILLNVVNTTGQFLLATVLNNAAIAQFGAEKSPAFLAFTTVFSASLNSTVNLVGLLVQLFLTSRIMRVIGVRGALFILPSLALINYSVIAVVPLLAVIRIGKILENSTDYSLQNTIRQALYLPVSREAKYKAKAAIDTFCTRLGDVVSAGCAVGGTAIGMGLAGFAWLNVALTVVWLFIAGQIAREHRRKTV
jgi:ATP:ADP antiporter, AAA family